MTNQLNPSHGELEEELAQIRRYEDFSTIGRYPFF